MGMWHKAFLVEAGVGHPLGLDIGAAWNGAKNGDNDMIY